MYYMIEITFRLRSEPVSLLISDAELERLSSLMIDRTGEPSFVDLATAYDQHVWLNLKKVRKVLVLNEGAALAFDPNDIQPSRQYVDAGEVDYPSIAWEADLWVERENPLHLYDLGGDEWVEIAASIECKEQFFRVSDEDNDTLIFSVSDIELVIGTERDRYSKAQRDGLFGVTGTYINYSQLPRWHEHEM